MNTGANNTVGRRLGGVRRSLRAPWRAVFGPIFQKEMAVAGRRGATYWIRALYTLGLLGAIAIAFFSRGLWREEGEGMSAASLESASSIARGLALSMVWLQFPLLSLIAAQLCSGAICEERGNRTLATLITAPLSGFDIVAGKLVSRMTQVVILLAISAPVLLMMRVYGGFDASAVFAGVACALASALLAGSLSVMYSIWHRRAWTVVLMTVMTMVLIYLAPIGLAVLASRFVSSYAPDALFDMLGYISLPLALMLATVEMDGPTGGILPSRAQWMITAPLNVLLALVITLWSAGALRRVMTAEASGWQPGHGSMMPWLRRKSTRPAASAEQPAPATGEASVLPRRAGRPSAEVTGNPVAWREKRTPLLGSRRVTIAVLVPVGLALLYMYIVSFGDEPALHWLVVMGCLGIQLIGSMVLTTSAIASERDGRTLDVLLTTPLSGMRIAMGKLVGCARRLGVPTVFVTLHLLVYAVVGYVSWWALAIIPAVLAGHSLLIAGTGLYFGARCRRGVTASVLNVVLALGLWVGGPMLAGAGGAYLASLRMQRYERGGISTNSEERLWADVATTLMAMHPAIATSATLDQSIEGDPSATQAWGFSFSAPVFAAAALSTASLAGGIGLFAAWRAGKRLERLRGNWR